MNYCDFVDFQNYYPAVDEDDTALVEGLITGACSLVQKETNRDFPATDYDLLLNGTGRMELELPYFPVISITRIATNPVNVLNVHNTDVTNSRATVTVGATGLNFARVQSAATHTNALLFATYPTVSAMAGAINALGGGWTAFTLGGNYDVFPSSELRSPQGGLGARLRTAGLILHADDMENWKCDPNIGDVFCPYGWVRGFQNYRIVFRAGFDPVPAEIVQATCELVKEAYLSRSIKPGLASEGLDKWNYSNAVTKSWDNLSLMAKNAINFYKNIRVFPDQNVRIRWN